MRTCSTSQMGWRSLLMSVLFATGTNGSVVLIAGEASAAPSVWSVTSSPSPGTTSNVLISVSCTSPTSCMAVGNQRSAGSHYRTLAETWDGSTWSVTASPNPGTADYLDSVSCTSPSRCVAVGVRYKRSKSRTLVEAWDGMTWSVVPSPNPGKGHVSKLSALHGVSCMSPTSCVAVGDFEAVGSDREDTLVESWHGSAWKIVASPNPAYYNYLNGISCTSPTNCVAVGSGVNTLVESWNGVAWKVVPSPNPGSGDTLNSVSCTGATSCVAVGITFAPASLTLVESWDGTAWSVTASPNPADDGNSLRGVSCTSSSDCVAAGDYFVTTNTFASLVESWDGIAWSVHTSPDPGSLTNLIYGVSCASSTDCMAVGSYTNDATGGTLTMSGSTPG